VGGVFCDSANQLSAAAFTYQRDPQGMIRTEPFLCSCEVEITTKLTQIDRPLIDCLCSVDYGKAALLSKLPENLFGRQSNAQIVDVTQEYSVAIMVSKRLCEMLDDIRGCHVRSEEFVADR
jgi:hypothetical protein